jgi:hypothetical protein
MNEFLNYLDEYNHALYCVIGSLTDDDYKSLEKIAELYMKMTFFTLPDKINMIMNDFKNNVTNVKIIFMDGELKAHKSILSLIPYFELLFEDCIGDVVYFNASIKNMNIIINSVYFNYINTLLINEYNVFDILLLFDMLMYCKDNLTFLLKKYIGPIIQQLLMDDNKFKLRLFENIITNMTNKDNKMCLDKIIKTNFKNCHDYMFLFVRFDEMFDKHEIINYIIKYEKYDYFNQLKEVDPKIILNHLIEIFHDKDCYYDIFTADCVYYNTENIFEADEDCEYIIIKSYFPLHYIKLNHFAYPNHIMEEGEDEINIQLDKSSDVTVGSKLVIVTDDMLFLNYYEITSIHKKIGDRLIPTTQLKYFPSIRHILTLNRPLTTDHGATWIMEDFNEI